MQTMQTLRNLNLKDKRVILRCDFDDVFNNNGEIADDFRIKKIVPTIEYLLSQGAKIIILGQAKNLFNDNTILSEQDIFETCDFSILAEYLARVLNRNVKFLHDFFGGKTKKEIMAMNPKEIILLGNLALQPRENSNNADFAKSLSYLGEIFVNEAFSISCCLYSSINHLPRLMPSAPGLLFEEELQELSKILNNPAKPLIVVMGGTNLIARIGAIEKLSKTASHILFGGEIANMILAAKRMSLGKFTADAHLESMAGKINLADSKIHLPVDGMVSLNPIDDEYMRIAAIGAIRKEEQCFDIGPATVLLFSEIINEAATIFWSGSMGYFENEKFAKGTLALAEAISRSRAYKIAAGRKTVAFLKKYGLRDKFSFVSTGELTALKFLAGEKIEGIKALERM